MLILCKKQRKGSLWACAPGNSKAEVVAWFLLDIIICGKWEWDLNTKKMIDLVDKEKIRVLHL